LALERTVACWAVQKRAVLSRYSCQNAVADPGLDHMADTRTEVWYYLRIARSRTALSSLAKKRRTSATAALQQFEELMRAAEVVGPAARPLPLFYALSQAGRAIAAVHVQDRSWELQGHGLEMPGDPGSVALLDRKIKPKKTARDSFHRVAKTTGSGAITTAVSLSDLWSSLPYDMPATNLPGPLAFTPSDYGWADRSSVQGVLEGLPEAAVSSLDALRAFLAAYPALHDWEPVWEQVAPGRPVPLWPVTDFGKAVRLRWAINGSSQREWSARLDEIAPQYLRRDVRWARPAIGENQDVLSPLMAWWALLYGLSMVARYEPAAWTEALDIDASPIAASLESLLENALTDVPQLVLNELQDQPHLRLQS
jgi:hypothetical protein